MRHLRGRIVLLLAVLLVTLRLGQTAVQESFYGPGALVVSRAVVIPPGSTADAARVLKADGVIAYPLVFRAAAYFTRARGPIRADEFFFRARGSLREALDILRFGAPVEHQVTIPEGLTGIQIATILNDAPAADGRIAPPPDGAVLPQTYDYTYGTPRQVIVSRATAAMQDMLGRAWAKRDPALSLATAQEALTLASIVQQETPLPAEMPEIAAVYENRLARGMKLQADPTVIYAASGGRWSGGVAITRADLGNGSPYNTYVYAGLPPGPIAAPGDAALDAVLHPARSDALFFVATGMGGHVFAADFKGQLANIAKYRGGPRD